MDALIEFGLFSGKILVVFIFIVALLVVALIFSTRNKNRPGMEIENLNEKNDELKDILSAFVLDKKDYKKQLKAKEKEEKKDKTKKAHVYQLSFDGDISASQVKELRDEVTAVLNVAQKGEEVVVCVESPGGMVSGYGLAAAELVRIRDAGLNLTVCVDKVAASGGYMMACTAHKIVAAPFAILGSIGVLAQVPNVHRLLKKHDIDYEEMTSGQYKRTVSVFGEITEKGREKFKEQLQDTHILFKKWVHTYRPQLNLEEVATGEYWFGLKAIDLKLVDQIETSDQYLQKLLNTHTVIKIKFQQKKKLGDKISEAFGMIIDRSFDKLLQKNNPL
ncbi:MAG: protease SohB [Bdellovibrionota bacterium]